MIYALSMQQNHCKNSETITLTAFLQIVFDINIILVIHRHCSNLTHRNENLSDHLEKHFSVVFTVLEIRQNPQYNTCISYK